MEGGAWSGVVAAISIAIIAALRQYYVQRATNADIARLSNQVREIKASEEECQDQRRRESGNLLRALQENVTLRETLPKEMVDNVKKLVMEAETQSEALSGIVVTNAQMATKLTNALDAPHQEFACHAQAAADQARKNFELMEKFRSESGEYSKDLLKAVQELIAVKKENLEKP